MKRVMLPALLIVGLAVATSPAVAAPPGSSTFEGTSANGEVHDALTFLGGPTVVTFDISVNTDGRINLNMVWEAFGGGYVCDYFGGSDVSPELSFVDDGSAIVVTVDASILPSGSVQLVCGDALQFAELTVFYSPGDRTERWHENRTGQQCRGTDLINDHASTAAHVVTVDQGEMVNSAAGLGSGNYGHTQGRCQLTGRPGKP